MDESRSPNSVARLRSSLRSTLQITSHHLLTINRYNTQTLRSQPLLEISGSFGDLGTLLPLLIALTTTSSISLSATLVFSGLANILTGLVYGIPLPVQPMKAIAAIAIAENFSPDVTASAGLFVAAAIGMLSLTGTMGWVTKRVPVPVVKGIQVGTGLSLAMSAGRLYRPGPGNLVILVTAFVGLLLSARLKRVPYALILFVVGVLCVVYQSADRSDPRYRNWPHLSIWKPTTSVPSTAAFERGFLEAGIGQLPLTALNSVIAVSFLAADLLPEVPTPSVTSIGISVAAINLVACWFGAMPVCHGSGGLAAQFRFGARSGASVIFLGVLKLVLGLFAHKIALWAFLGFPSVLLCVLVIAAGLELAKVGESLNTDGSKDLEITYHLDGNGKAGVQLTEEERMRRWMTMLATVAGTMAFHNTGVGFLAGMLCFGTQKLMDWWEERRRRGRIRLEGA